MTQRNEREESKQACGGIRSEAEQRCGDEGKGEMKWNLRMLCLEDQIKRVQCVFAFYVSVFCVYIQMHSVLVRLNVCMHVYLCVCVCVCVTQLWLALQLITRYSQLLITRHLFCPRSTLFCAYYQPGSGRRIRGRALSNTLLLKFSSLLFPPWLCAAEDTSACISSRLRTQQTVRHLGPCSICWSFSWVEACLLSVMTLWQSRGDQFHSTSCLEAPWAVFWDSLACKAALLQWFIRVCRAVTPLASGKC